MGSIFEKVARCFFLFFHDEPFDFLPKGLVSVIPLISVSTMSIGKPYTFLFRLSNLFLRWSISSLFLSIFFNVQYGFRIIEVPYDGNCGYSAMRISREKAANLLLNNLHNKVARELIGLEIEDNFEGLAHLLWSHEYKTLIDKRAGIDGSKREFLSAFNTTLGRSEGAKLCADELLAYRVTDEFPLEELLQSSLQELEDQENNLIQEKKNYCSAESIIRFYIKDYIRPSTHGYKEAHPYQEENWMNLSALRRP